jgi:hypothetical protein
VGDELVSTLRKLTTSQPALEVDSNRRPFAPRETLMCMSSFHKVPQRGCERELGGVQLVVYPAAIRTKAQFIRPPPSEAEWKPRRIASADNRTPLLQTELNLLADFAALSRQPSFGKHLWRNSENICPLFV